jgi:hypothetical protein
METALTEKRTFFGCADSGPAKNINRQRRVVE